MKVVVVLNLVRSEVLDAHKMGFRQHFETTILLLVMVFISGGSGAHFQHDTVQRANLNFVVNIKSFYEWGHVYCLYFRKQTKLI